MLADLKYKKDWKEICDMWCEKRRNSKYITIATKRTARMHDAQADLMKKSGFILMHPHE